IGEYDRLRDALDNEEIPLRVIPRIDPDDRLEFDSIEEAGEALVDALDDGDLEEADRVFASVPEDWRYEVENIADDFGRDAYREGDYADAYAVNRFEHYDNTALWILHGDYVNGRVTETGSGTPIPGATITFNDSYSQSTQTNADGEFRILVRSDMPAALEVEHPDYDLKRVFNTGSGAPITPQSLAGDTLEILLGTGFPKLTFRGRVVDAETGQPLAGVPVMAGFDPIEGATELNLQQVMGKFGRETDADGRFEITELPVQDIHVMAQTVVDGKLYLLQRENLRFEDDVEQIIEVSSRAVQLDIPLVVVGTVKDRVTGEPVANASVSAGGWKTERTDDNGRFMIQLGTGEDWQLTASHDWYHQSQPQPFASAEPRTIEAEFLLDPITTGTILGTAINATTGEPIANAVIEIAGQQVRTDSQGRFRAEEIESGEVSVSGAQSGFRADNQTLLLEALQTAEATLELEPITTGTITGIVVERDTGVPLPGVAVRAGDVTATTGDDGTFILEEVEAGAISVAASKSLYVPASSDVMLEAMNSVEARLALEPITWGTVRGDVRDATTGQPLANAKVRIGATEVTTDADGNYVAERVPAGDISIVAGITRYHDAQAATTLPRDGDVEQSLELAPITTGTVYATIIDASSGEPIGGAEVMIGQRRDASDDAGQVTAEEIPAGRVVVNASARLYEPGSAEAVLDAAGESRLEIELVPITYGTITGTVVDSVSGAPLANADIRFAGLALRSDAQGTFRAERVPAGEVSVSADLFRYRGDQETVALERGTEQAVNLALEPITTGTVRGIVRNAADGRPVNGATITIGNLSARSNVEGRFEIENVPAGDLSVRANLTLFEPGESPVSLEAAASIDTEIQLTPITYGTVSGTVVNADTGEPLENAAVSAGRQSTRTNAAGEFELQRVSAGDVSVLASRAVHIDDSTRITLAAGASESVTLRLQPITWGTVTGVVTDADTGRPLVNAEVIVGTEGLRSDNAGRFRAENVPAGSLRIAGTMPAYEAGSVTTELQADAERDVTLALVPIRIGDISGTVLDAKTGEPISQARVTTGRLAAETDAAGRFSFESVATGGNVVAAQHPDYANGSASAVVPPAETVDVVIELDLRREDVTNLEAELAKSGTIDLYGIYFDSGRDQFKPSSLQTLRAVLEVMKRAPDRRFEIAGHTDSDGGDGPNQDLSERRAKTVIGWLVDNGVDGARLDGVGFGETRPAAPNDTESGKALNRRVQLSFAD
ncbi:MAG: carboxypeptidase regulatory-like domain-containing protein, partial [Gammaproteobacteria bacterium]|nr:carboxypeptidase regulatory-like domain-containing protein [Gammaproteobacteria bacterium]